MMLKSNSDLFSYLEKLEGGLLEVGHFEEAAEIRRARRTSAGLSTEFLGESLHAMEHVSDVVHLSLSELQKRDFNRVISDLKLALRQR